ncbi:OsmC-like protein [Rubripirellula obstinata]|uniref:OsmC-like protein n=1 Tax=Rubripirellula obstinata TaxID=406547 RepID=A0A5B1CPG3_9BACT|nr:OsmC family protein [Rubripirellula obstinata]KAA1262141.1 OsmC-like protein [Rubripirellula obstinata]
MSVEIKAVYSGKLRCDATHGPSGMTLHTDAPVDNGGSGGSFSPTDLVGTALGTCVMTIVGLMADRHQLNLEGMQVHVVKEMIANPVRRIGALKTTVTIPAGVVDDPSMRLRIEAAARKCPVHQSLHPDIDAPINFRYSV